MARSRRANLRYKQCTLEELQRRARKQDIYVPRQFGQNPKKAELVSLLKAAKFYQKCTKDDLMRFATDRKLHVIAAKATPTKREYVSCLANASQRPSFDRFMDLIPELRNQIYEELLTFKGSYTCSPQILVTSKTVRQEATELLYGNNLVEIKLWHDGLYIHGNRVNPHSGYDWPAFLRKTWFIRVSLGEDLAAYAISGSRILEIQDAVVRSLCNFLAQDHRLRSLAIDFPPRVLRNDVHPTDVDIYPIRMLGEIAELTLNGTPIQQQQAAPEMSIQEATSNVQQAHDDFKRVVQSELDRIVPPGWPAAMPLAQGYDSRLWHFARSFHEGNHDRAWQGGADEVGTDDWEEDIDSLILVACYMSIRQHGAKNIVATALTELFHRWTDFCFAIVRGKRVRKLGTLEEWNSLYFMEALDLE